MERTWQWNWKKMANKRHGNGKEMAKKGKKMVSTKLPENGKKNGMEIGRKW